MALDGIMGMDVDMDIDMGIEGDWRTMVGSDVKT